MDVYSNCPSVENDHFLLRQTVMEDCVDLLLVYSDEMAVPYFNSDNCYGDDFHYKTHARMLQAIDFWEKSYLRRDFVRWSIIDKRCGHAIGTIELFHRDADDAFTNTGLLRLDLRSDYEKATIIEEILSLLINDAFDWFECATVSTKAIPEAVERRKALENLGFRECINTIKGHHGERYGSYFMLFKMHKQKKYANQNV